MRRKDEAFSFMTAMKRAENQFRCRCQCAFASFAVYENPDNKSRFAFSPASVAIVESFLPVHRLVFTIAIYFPEDFLVPEFSAVGETQMEK